MRIVRFSPPAGSKLGSDPHFGLLEDDMSITAIASDPLYAGIFKQEEVFALSEVKLLAPVIPRSKVVCVGKTMPIMQPRWAGKYLLSQLFLSNQIHQ
ncbi:hypothetical protein EMGBS5_05370 [Clavibacter sp.]|nr:hypothetical protein EMGBS5_05370 [Clavibacter sp.]